MSVLGGRYLVYLPNGYAYHPPLEYTSPRYTYHYPLGISTPWLYLLPWLYLYPLAIPMPLDIPTCMGIPTLPGRDLGPEIPTPCGQTHTCENITFQQLRWRTVTSLADSNDLLWKCFGYLCMVADRISHRRSFKEWVRIFCHSESSPKLVNFLQVDFTTIWSVCHKIVWR